MMTRAGGDCEAGRDCPRLRSATNNIQVLTPMQKCCRADTPAGNTTPRYTWRLAYKFGDRVMQIRNNDRMSSTATSASWPVDLEDRTLTIDFDANGQYDGWMRSRATPPPSTRARNTHRYHSGPDDPLRDASEEPHTGITGRRFACLSARLYYAVRT